MLTRTTDPGHQHLVGRTGTVLEAGHRPMNFRARFGQEIVELTFEQDVFRLA